MSFEEINNLKIYWDQVKKVDLGFRSKSCARIENFIGVTKKKKLKKWAKLLNKGLKNIMEKGVFGGGLALG